ncbi:MAG: SIR2 family protein [Aliishimia sp.]
MKIEEEEREFSAKDNEEEASYFHTVREQLQFWPYSIHQIDDTLDSSLIEARAKQLLFRAIHARNLTAFVGSGLSMSYGRLNWRDWEKEQRRTVHQQAKIFEDLSDVALKWVGFLTNLLDPKLVKKKNKTPIARKILNSALWKELHLNDDKPDVPLMQKDKHNVWQWLRGRQRAIQAARQRVGKLHKTFKLTEMEDGHFPGGEELPVKFEIAQQLHNELQRQNRLFLPEEFPEGQFPTGEIPDKIWPGATFRRRTDAPVDGIKSLRKLLDAGADDLQSVQDKLLQDYSDQLEVFWNLNLRPEAQLDFETLSKTLLVDECPHAAILLRRGILRNQDRDTDLTEIDQRLTGLERRLKVFAQDNQKRDISGIRENDERYRVLTPFKFENARSLIQQAIDENPAGSDFSHFLTAVDAELSDYIERTDKAGVKRVYLTPSSRYLVALALALIDDPFKALGVGESGEIGPYVSKNGETHTRKMASHPLGPPEVESFTSRRSILAERYDPMPKIHRDLKINRFITTNYDFEIERYFQDIGYRSFDLPASGKDDGPGQHDAAMRSDEIGHTLRDTCFSPEQAATLIGFAMAENGANVFHLHGRATKTDRLVITERDYMRLYLTDNAHRPTIDEGIQVAFSGAPLLFLGLGMEETDLLRPLRQFISNRDRTIGQTSIALLPAEKGLAARTKFAAALYMRYGVHTIFYGSGQLSYQKDEKTHSIDWLHRIIQLCSAIRDELDWWEKKTPDDIRDESDVLKALIKKVGSIGPDMAEGEAYPAKTLALLVLLDYRQFKLSNRKALKALVKRLTNLERNAVEVRSETSDNSEPQPKRGTAAQPILLRTCAFAPTRPSRHRLAHRLEAETRIDGDQYVGFYTRQLDRLMTMVLKLPANLKGKNAKEVLAHCAPLRIALDGLQGAFITGSLNAALDGIAEEKRAWWNSWQETPDHRLAEFQRIRPDGENGGSVEDPLVFGTTFLRHKLDNVLTPLERANRSKVTGALIEHRTDGPVRLAKSNRTHVRAFDTFVAAIASTFRHRRLKKKERDAILYLKANQSEKAWIETESERRQLVTVAARRGMGKGTFMSAFVSKLGKDAYEKAAWPQSDVFFAGSIHVNLGLSPEIASAYDMIASALIAVVAALETNVWAEVKGSHLKPSDNEIAAYNKKLRDDKTAFMQRLSRLAGLKDLFLAFSEQASIYRARYKSGKSFKGQPRLLLNICAADLLFDARGWPKNREIDNIIKLLFSVDLANCPIDIVFLADDTRLGEPWNLPEGKSPHPRRYLDRAGLNLFADEQVGRALGESRINMDENVEHRNERFKTRLPCLPHPALQTGKDVLEGDHFVEPHYVHFTRSVNTAWLLIDNFPVLAMALHLLNPPQGNDASIPNVDWGQPGLKAVRELFSEAVLTGRKSSDEAMDIAWRQRPLAKAAKVTCIRGFVDRKAREAVADHISGQAYAVSNDPDVQNDLDAALRYRLKRDVNKRDAQDWRTIRRGLGNSRFSLTILLAAAENIVVHSERPSDSAKHAERLLLDTVARVRALGQERRDQMVFETVLETYRKFHEIGRPDLDCDLHLLLIKHLGVIGTPVGSSVLVRLSGIREYFSRIGIETDTSRRRFIVRALTTMAHRGLVFRLDPHPRLVSLYEEQNRDDDWEADQEFRYTLHRVVQNYALNKLEAGPLEPVATNRFAPTLYSAMPSHGPTLSRKSYQFLRALIIGLSQYPDIPAEDDSAEPWLFTTRDHSVRVQAARAAVALARSNFSVAVVSRLNMDDPTGAGVQRRGHLETYRVRLRWLIRIAYELAQQEQSDNGERKVSNPDGPHKHLNVLYRDEIIWLYNELGVIALAQGALSDALGYLRQAAEANERIEGLARGAPIFNHIDLNHAVVQMERGQFTSARRRLERVKAQNSKRKRQLYHIAEGYLCVLDHLQGLSAGLDKRFKRVTSFLQRNGEDRAAAIFLMHHGRFLWKEDAERMTELVARARNLAESTGHEDVRHHAELTTIRLRLANQGPGRIDLKDQKILGQVENFARRMAIWSLSVDTLMVRARILLEQNEHRASGRLLTRAMAIAKRHAMNLRLNNCLTIYAQLLLQRGDVDGAFGIAQQSLNMAKRSNYALETGRAQRVIRECRLAHGTDI